MTDKLTLGALAGAVIAVSALVHGTRVLAHVAPSGMVYPSWCCKSAATSPTGDCAPISEKYIKERPDGYHVNIPAGAHPQLKTRAYSAVIPYDQAKVSEDGSPHICLAYEGTHKFCFFMPPRLG